MLSLRDFLIVLTVVCAWGFNFVVIKWGLGNVPPMLLGALRFTLAAFPAVLFVKRPAVPLKWVLAYGATVSFGQFALLFLAIYLGMPAGLAALVLQAQAFFTLGFAALFLDEPIHARSVVGLVVAACGLVVIGASKHGNVTFACFGLTLLAAMLWGLGNIITKKIGKVDLVGLVVWTSLIPPIPFLILSYFAEGPRRMAAALFGFDWTSAFAVVYLAFVATLLANSLWSRLLSRHPASQVAPFSLLVPVVGIGCAILLLDEHLSGAQVLGCALIMAGLLVNVFGDSIRKRLVAWLRPVGS